MTDEIQPFLLHRIVDGQVEFALWQLREGQRAIALFLNADSATAYAVAAELSGDWQVFHPEKEMLWKILQFASEAGMRWAVLEPDQEKAKRIFDIGEILRQGREAPISG